MHIDHHTGHLTYCSNIHPGESWPDTFTNLKDYVTRVRNGLTTGAFGIGLRLSNEASVQLLANDNLIELKSWLQKENMYVFTINGFPYGGFHHQVVKDQVHGPDWTSGDRLAYTIRLFDILKQLLPIDMDGGVSTSPISYKFWHKDESARALVKKQACQHLADLTIHLHKIKNATGKILHLDMEPEPDGILETSQEFIDFFNQYLMIEGAQKIQNELSCSATDAENIIRLHFQLCYDVCHFAVGFEKSSEALAAIAKEKIKIGRIQISAALSSGLINSHEMQSITGNQLSQFDESTYLHQAVIKSKNGKLDRYPDLRPALAAWTEPDQIELRTHFHVPVFTEKYGQLIPTQQDIIDVLTIWKEKNFTNHLEVETYTWDVLPPDMRTDIVSSVIRELKWVMNILEAE